MAQTDRDRLLDAWSIPNGAMVAVERIQENGKWTTHAHVKGAADEEWQLVFSVRGTKAGQEYYDRMTKLMETILKCSMPEIFEAGPRTHREGEMTMPDGEVQKITPPKPNASMLHKHAEDEDPFDAPDDDPFGFDEMPTFGNEDSLEEAVANIEAQDEAPVDFDQPLEAMPWQVVIKSPGDKPQMLVAMIKLMGDDVDTDDLQEAVVRIAEKDLQCIGCSSEQAARTLASEMEKAGCLTLVLKHH